MTVRYRVFAWVAIAVVAVLSWLALSFLFAKPIYADAYEQGGVSVHAKVQPAHNDVFGAAEHSNATMLSAPPSDKYLDSGTYCLSNDLVLTEGLELLGTTVNLCLHGHSLTVPKDHVFEIYGSEGVLNIYDCVGTGTMSCGNREGVYIFNGATFNMYGGAIKGCSDSGVSVAGKGVFNMYDGVIADNVSSGNGGGVAVWTGGTFNMYGGTISNNTTTKYYGGAGVDITSADSVFRMYGGSIINNVLDCSKETSEDSLALFYKGAGVDFGTGTFSIEGDVNISGNIRKVGSSQVINNVELDNSKRKIEITGALGANARIGVTAAAGVFTTGYALAGNTVDPSEYFTSDSGMTIGFDDLNKEGEIKSGSTVGGYNMTGATVTGVSGTATVGDTSVTLIVDVTLKNNVNNSPKTVSDVKTVNLGSPLHGGENTVNFDYTYNGADGENTVSLTYKFVPAKLHTSVTWVCSDSATTPDGRNAVKRDYDGSDILGSITASYVGYDGEQKSIVGTSSNVIVTNNAGNVVASTANVGVYTISLAPSVDYEFDNNTFTVTVNAVIEDDGYYKVQTVTATGATGTPTVGDRTVTVTIEKTLKHTKDGTVRTERENTQVTLSAPLSVGNNSVAFDYKYNDVKEGEKTVRLTLTVTAAQKRVTVAWYYNNVAAGSSVERDYDGEDVLGSVLAKYAGYDGVQKTIRGTSTDIIVKDANNNVVTSVAAVGVYTISLAPSADYVFDNNEFTLTVNAVNVEDGYYKIQTVTALGVEGTPTAGDKSISVTVEKALKHTKNGTEKTETSSVQVTLSSALHVGSNKIAFDYKYVDAVEGEKTIRIPLKVTAVKKQVTVTWYYDNAVTTGNTANCIYDGADAAGKIVAQFVGIDGTKRIDGTSALVIKKDESGNVVTSLTAVGKYTLSLNDTAAVLADYSIGNNTFICIIAGNPGNLSDLTYEEDEEIILGVSSDEGFESGTEVFVEKVEDFDSSVVDGNVSTALNVTFIKDSVEVTPTGVVTVRVLIPDELRDGAKYKIYNLNNGVATEVRYVSDGNYATFELDELSTILFVTQDSAPNGGGEGGIVIDATAFIWLWVLLGIIAVCAVVSTVVLVVKKRNKK